MLPILFVTVFIDLVGFGIIIPFLAYYVESFGARAATVGLLMSTYSVAQFIFAPIWGRISDRVGRRPILLLGLTGSVAGYTLFGLAGTLWLLFVGRAAMGIFGATIPTAQAAVADVTSPQDRAKGMGLIGAAIGLGFILGPALGGVLSNLSGAVHGSLFRQNPYALPCLASAALAALNLVAAALFLPESLSPANRGSVRPRLSRFRQLTHGLAEPRLRSLVLVYFLFMLGFTMMEATLTLFIEKRVGARDHAQLVRRVGYLFGFIGIIQVALQGGLVGRLAHRFRRAPAAHRGLRAGGDCPGRGAGGRFMGREILRLRVRARLRARALAALGGEPHLQGGGGGRAGGHAGHLAVGVELRARGGAAARRMALPGGGAGLAVPGGVCARAFGHGPCQGEGLTANPKRTILPPRVTR